MNIDYINNFLSLFNMHAISDIEGKKTYIYNDNDEMVGKLYIDSKKILSFVATKNNYLLTGKLRVKNCKQVINYLLKNNDYDIKMSGSYAASSLGEQNCISIIKSGKKTLKFKIDSTNNSVFFEIIDMQQKLDVSDNRFAHKSNADFSSVFLEYTDGIFMYTKKDQFNEDIDGAYPVYKDLDVDNEFLDSLSNIDTEYYELIDALKERFGYFDSNLYTNIVTDTLNKNKSRVKLLTNPK